MAKSDGNLNHSLHWIVYGYDRVWYKERAYLGPGREFTSLEFEKEFGEGHKFIETGEKVIGLPVYDTIRNDKVSTLLFLKKPNGNLIIYTLSGGP
ncbi:hypothetical protein [Neobacillus terrae]|uniref:hypothetical protein n=1 Tax=Neobacillus terrae TaxID=3034837 RepID=UPI00140E88D2|nr:hypothetical protein [Neobacillus terrae]NHM32917.1 hypothetical protein [Neobacillus terrae]